MVATAETAALTLFARFEQHANQIDKRRDGQRRRFDKEQVDRERHAAAHEAWLGGDGVFIDALLG